MDKACASLCEVLPFLQMATTQPFMNRFWWNLDWMFFVPWPFKKKFFDPHQGDIGRFICHHKFTRVIPESLKKSCLYKNCYKICFLKKQNWIKFCKISFLIWVHLGCQEVAKDSKFEKFCSIPLASAKRCHTTRTCKKGSITYNCFQEGSNLLLSALLP